MLPLSAVATLRLCGGTAGHLGRDRVPTITVKAGIVTTIQPATVVAQLQTTWMHSQRPAGRLRIEAAGRVAESAKSQGPIAAVAPLMLFVMATILMFQLQSFSRLFLVVAVAPLGLIGVVAALLPSGAPLGFVAILGILALIGILIRNSVILVVQIEDLRATAWRRGMPWWTPPSTACGRSC